MATQTVNVRINKDIKEKAQIVAEKLGLDLSSAVKIFINKMISTESIPFEIRTENGYTPTFEATILKEYKDLKKNGKRYSNAEEAIRELGR